MTQDTGPEDEGTQTAGAPDEAQEGSSKRSSAWPWLALAIVLLLAIWLIWQYLGGVRKASETKVVVISTEVTLTPGGAASGAQEPAGGVVKDRLLDRPTRVPDVVGMSRSSAIAALEAAGYRASVTDVFGTNLPAGAVFQQNPTAGAVLDVGEPVGLLVQLRPSAKPKTTVPKLTGLSQSAAESKLKSLGIRVVLSYFPDSGDPGRVKSQWPLAGEQVVKGGDVQIQITVKP